jgi:hypothetical protein
MVTLAAIGLCLAGPSAHAAVSADFNGDGIPDRVILPRASETTIVVRVSGEAPQVLRFVGRLVGIVAADINHDGHVDLGALSERRGLFIWLNRGHAQRGRLKAVAQKPRMEPFGLSRGGSGRAVPGAWFDRVPLANSFDNRERAARSESPSYASSELRRPSRFPDPRRPIPAARRLRAPHRAPDTDHQAVRADRCARPTGCGRFGAPCRGLRKGISCAWYWQT